MREETNAKEPLRNCPICGSPVKVGVIYNTPMGLTSNDFLRLDKLSKSYYIECKNTDCCLMTKSYGDEEELIKKYNGEIEQ